MNFAQIRYTSSLQEAEFNIRRVVPMPEGRLAVSILFGLRYVGLPEEFDYYTSSAEPAPPPAPRRDQQLPRQHGQRDGRAAGRRPAGVLC